ncbi:hypothetical protein LINPERPRIM_LOCUS33065 [Linum perenne]
MGSKGIGRGQDTFDFNLWNTKGLIMSCRVLHDPLWVELNAQGVEVGSFLGGESAVDGSSDEC